MEIKTMSHHKIEAEWELQDEIRNEMATPEEHRLGNIRYLEDLNQEMGYPELIDEHRQILMQLDDEQFRELYKLVTDKFAEMNKPAEEW